MSARPRSGGWYLPLSQRAGTDETRRRRASAASTAAVPHHYEGFRHMALTAEGIIEVPGMASRWVRLGSGAKAHHMTSGDHGPTVLLLHGGLPGSSGTAGWRFMAPFLGANGFRV